VESRWSGIYCSWDNKAETFLNFDGYEVWRAKSVMDAPTAVYEKIFDCSKSQGNLTNELNDTSAAEGPDYFYYVVSKDDGSTNDIHPGTPLISSKFMTMTSLPSHRLSGVDEGGSVVVRSFHLGQNHPNPFNHSTVIPFFLEKPGTVRLSIYDVQGRRVWELSPNVFPAGRNEAVWNGTDMRGTALSSGIYFCSALADGKIQTVKLVLVE
jgi:hypothetical protein